MFEHNGSNWLETAKLVPADSGANDLFGNAVAVSGDHIVVGARADDNIAADAGSAYVFERQGSSWQEVAKLLPSNGAAGDQFGMDVALDHDTVLVGAWLGNGVGNDSGTAYVFERLGGQWTETAKLQATDGESGDDFGRALAIAGGQVVVGAIDDGDGGAAAGAAYLFVWDGGAWVQMEKFVASDPSSNDQLGISVSMDGGSVLLGAYVGDGAVENTGAAYAYDMTDCDDNLAIDSCEIAADSSLDLNGNGVLDVCECRIDTYCQTAPNSVGPGATIGVVGLPSISAGALVLTAANCPAMQFGVFFHGPGQQNTPFGNGFICVTGPIVRQPVVVVGTNGVAAWPLDLQQFQAGTTRNFQFWYRDPAGGAAFNLTDGLAVTFCD